MTYLEAFRRALEELGVPDAEGYVEGYIAKHPAVMDFKSVPIRPGTEDAYVEKLKVTLSQLVATTPDQRAAELAAQEEEEEQKKADN